MIRRSAIIVAWGCLAALGPGCGQYEFNRRTFRFEQVGPRSRPAVRAGAEAPADASAQTNATMGEQIPPPAAKAPVRLSPRQKATFEKGKVFTLYLGDESVEKKPGQSDLYLVKQATPDKLAELLVLLFPGDGPGGSVRLRFISYSDEQTWAQAMAFASRLDVAAIRIQPGIGLPETAAEWDLAIGLVYGSEFPRKMDPDIRFRAVSLLNHILKDPGAGAEQRWAAGILAATLQTRFEPRDLVAASATLSQTLRLTSKQDYKALVIRYHYIRQLMARGQTLTARRHAQDALNYFQGLDDTNCYRFLRTIVEQK